MTDLPAGLGQLADGLHGELPDLAYRAIPAPSDVEESIRQRWHYRVNSALVCNRMFVQQCQRTQSYISGLPVDGYNQGVPCAPVSSGVSCMAPLPIPSKARLCRFLFATSVDVQYQRSPSVRGQRIAPHCSMTGYRSRMVYSRRICATDGTYALCP